MKNSIKKKSVDSASTEVHSNGSSNNCYPYAVYKIHCQPITIGECGNLKVKEQTITLHPKEIKALAWLDKQGLKYGYDCFEESLLITTITSEANRRLV